MIKIVICDSYEDMSALAADHVAEVVKTDADCTIGLATGSTPIGMYKKLVERYESGELDFSSVRTFNLDEYYPISPKNGNSYRYFMEEHLFKKVNLKCENINFPKGDAEDALAECDRYENLIINGSPIDIQILGIGQNGHIGFNEPSDELNASVHLTELNKSTIMANSRFFDSEDEVPKRAITMGMGGIFSARKIILLANGVEKHKALRSLLDDKITSSVPATLLKLHPNVVVICDREAYYG